MKAPTRRTKSKVRRLIVMKNSYLTKRFGLAFLAIALCIAAGVGTTFAYYTDATSAAGSLPYNADKPQTTIEEDKDPAGKSITLTNTSQAPSVVRVKLYFAETNADIMIYGQANANWGFDDNDPDSGWIYYNEILWPGETTSVLRADITSQGKDKALDDFAVNVVAQCVPVTWQDGEGDESGYEVGNFDDTIVNFGEIMGITKGSPVPGQKPSGM